MIKIYIHKWPNGDTMHIGMITKKPVDSMFNSIIGYWESYLGVKTLKITKTYHIK